MTIFPKKLALFCTKEKRKKTNLGAIFMTKKFRDGVIAITVSLTIHFT